MGFKQQGHGVLARPRDLGRRRRARVLGVHVAGHEPEGPARLRGPRAEGDREGQGALRRSLAGLPHVLRGAVGRFGAELEDRLLSSAGARFQAEVPAGAAEERCQDRRQDRSVEHEVWNGAAGKLLADQEDREKDTKVSGSVCLVELFSELFGFEVCIK